MIKNNLIHKFLTLFLLFNLLFALTPLTTLYSQSAPPVSARQEFAKSLQSGLDKQVADGEEFRKNNPKGTGCFSLTTMVFGDWGSWIGACLGSLVNSVVWAILYFVNWVAEMVLFLVGKFADMVISITVLNYKDYFVSWGGEGTGPSNYIYLLWSFIRDFLNTFVFFIIMYHAIRSIIVGYEEIKNQFIYLLVFALLVNFSLLFVKVVVDVSNIATLSIYQSALPNATNESLGNTVDLNSVNIQVGLETPLGNVDEVPGVIPQFYPETFADFIVNRLNPNESEKSNAAKGEESSDRRVQVDTAVYQLGRFFVLIYLIYFFIVIASTFLIRAVAFVGAMILSPIIVAKFFYESSRLSDLADKIKSALFEHALRGPMYLLVALISASLAANMVVQGAENAAAENASLLSQQANMFLRFVTFIAMFEFMKRIVDGIVDSIAGEHAPGRGYATALAGKMGRGLLRGGGIAGALTFGNLGRGVVDSKIIGRRLRNMQASEYGAVRAIGRGITRTGNLLANGTYDMANLRLAKTGFKQIGLDAGEGGKGNARNLGDTIKKAITEYKFNDTKKKSDLIENTGKGFRKVDENTKNLGDHIKNAIAGDENKEKEIKNKYVQERRDTQDKANELNLDDVIKTTINNNIAKSTEDILKNVKEAHPDFNDDKKVQTYAEAIKKIEELKTNADKEVKAIKEEKENIKKIAEKLQSKDKKELEKATKDAVETLNKRSEKIQSDAKEKILKRKERQIDGSVLARTGYVIGAPFAVKPADIRKAIKEGIGKVAKEEAKEEAKKYAEKTYKTDAIMSSIYKALDVADQIEAVGLSTSEIRSDIKKINDLYNEVIKSEDKKEDIFTKKKVEFDKSIRSLVSELQTKMSGTSTGSATPSIAIDKRKETRKIIEETTKSLAQLDEILGIRSKDAKAAGKAAAAEKHAEEKPAAKKTEGDH